MSETNRRRTGGQTQITSNPKKVNGSPVQRISLKNIIEKPPVTSNFNTIQSHKPEKVNMKQQQRYGSLASR